MKEIEGNLWDYHYGPGKSWTVITTNGFVNNKKPRECTMGRGVALDAKQRFKTLAADLGKRILESGNHTYLWPKLGIITCPVKHNWWEPADTELIVRSVTEMVEQVQSDVLPVYAVRFGCGNGGLNWVDVKPLVEPLLDDRFTIVDWPEHIPHIRRRGQVRTLSNAEITSIETEAWKPNPGSRYWSDMEMLRAIATIRQLQANAAHLIELPSPAHDRPQQQLFTF